MACNLNGKSQVFNIFRDPKLGKEVIKKINDPQLQAVLVKQSEIDAAFEAKAQEEGRSSLVRKSSPSKKKRGGFEVDLPQAMLKKIDSLVER